jgi:hypothetical protein
LLGDSEDAKGMHKYILCELRMGFYIVQTMTKVRTNLDSEAGQKWTEIKQFGISHVQVLHTRDRSTHLSGHRATPRAAADY